MEPSRTDQLQADLFVLLRASRRDGSYLPLYMLGELIAEALDTNEHALLANFLLTYAPEATDAEVCA
jgi:hypothetical protein